MTRILIAGATGQIGRELARTLAALGEIVAPARAVLDLERPASIRAVLRDANPAVIVNAAAFAAMDEAETDPGRAQQVNGVAPGVIAEEAARLGALLVHYSSAYVFSGDAGRPYREDDPPGPINAYGASKLAGERAIAATAARHLVLRLSWVHSLHGANFLTAILRLARERPELPVVEDQTGSPTWARSVAAATARLIAHPDLDRAPSGIYHLSAAGAVSRRALAQAILAGARRVLGEAAPRARVVPVASADYPLPAARPRYAVLDNARLARAFGIRLPDWRVEIDACLAELAGAP
ncbi:MAG: dTDP-4-dehydrorhamnose reductase [Burkholderiales bacterium]|nr:dTDP-4-dehydrorhamnose reductase [Burkholderiales bacterium]